MILIDSNIIIDLTGAATAWHEWSRRAVRSLGRERQLVVNAVVRAETARQFRAIEAQHAFLDLLNIVSLPITDQAAYRAGQAYTAYRQAGGAREGILADFLIGAHAAVLGATLLTRDRQRFAAYFPEVTLITPETQP